MDLNADPYNPYPTNRTASPSNRRPPPIPWTPAQKKAAKEGLAWAIGFAVAIGGIILASKAGKKPGRRRR
jgi:hypothetical protein